MTRREDLRERLAEAQLRVRSYRKLGKQIGISHTAVGAFLKEPDKADESTVSLIQRWAEGRPLGDPDTTRKKPPSVERKAAGFDLIAGVVGLISDGATDDGRAIELLLRMNTDLRGPDGPSGGEDTETG